MGVDIHNWAASDAEPIFTHDGDADEDGPFSAGWMEKAEVARHIAEAVEEWRVVAAAHMPAHAPGDGQV